MVLCFTVNGGWGPWSLFTACSATCGVGTKSRSRTCNNPAPQNGGAECVTVAGIEDLQETETVACTLTACPSNSPCFVSPIYKANVCVLTAVLVKGYKMVDPFFE